MFFQQSVGRPRRKLAAILHIVVDQERIVQQLDGDRRVQRLRRLPPNAAQVAKHNAARKPFPGLRGYSDTSS